MSLEHQEDFEKKNAQIKSSFIVQDNAKKQPSVKQQGFPVHHPLAVKNDFLLNTSAIVGRIRKANEMNEMIIEQTGESIKFLNMCLEIYLKNVIQALITYSRKRNYSYTLPYKANNKKINVHTYNYSREIITSREMKINYEPFKTFSLFYTKDIPERIELLEKYKSLKETKNQEEDKKPEAMQVDKEKQEEYQEDDYYCNVYNSSDITRNYKISIPQNKKRTINLTDLLLYLEKNQRTPFHRVLLHRISVFLSVQNN